MQKVSDLEGWPWQPDLCPADEQFIEWLDWRRMPLENVFHMGTGLHHKVGLYCLKHSIACLGITASRAESLATTEFPQMIGQLSYVVLETNIYDIDFRLFARFDVMTLFHLGEMVERFGELQTPAIYELLYHARQVAFYTKSSAWDRTKDVVQDFVGRGYLHKSEAYKDLEFYNT